MRAGRPKGAKDERPWTAALRKALAERDKASGSHKIDRLAVACVDAGIGGDIGAMKEVGDRLEGRPLQAQLIQGDPNLPVKHEHVLTFKSGV